MDNDNNTTLVKETIWSDLESRYMETEVSEVLDIQYRSIITSFYTRVHAWQHDKTIISPVTCLRGPRLV